MFTPPKHVSNPCILTGYLWWILPLLDVSCIISPPILMTWWGTVSWTTGKGVENVSVGVWGLGWSQLYVGRDSFVESLQHSICEWDSPWTFEKIIGRVFFIFLPIRLVKLSCFLWVLHLGPRFVIRTLDIGSLDWWSLMIMTCSNTSERLGYWTIKICQEVPGKFSQLLPVYCTNKPLQLFILANNELNELLFAHQTSVVLVQN